MSLKINVPTNASSGDIEKAQKEWQDASNKIGGWVGKLMHKNTPEFNENMSIYREAAVAKESADTVKRQVEEKQMRALRNQYRGSAGLLGRPSVSSSQLGSSGSLPNKLGTA